MPGGGVSGRSRWPSPRRPHPTISPARPSGHRSGVMRAEGGGGFRRKSLGVTAAGSSTAACAIASKAASTDQWGEVHAAGPLLPPPQVEQWVRYLGIRCAG